MSNLSANPIHSTLEIHPQSNWFLKCYSWYLVYATITPERKESEGEVTKSSPTLHGPMDRNLHQAPPSTGFSGKSSGVGCHFLLQGIFPTQVSNPGLPHCRQTLYRLSHKGSTITPRRDYYSSFLIDLSSATFTSSRLSWTYSQNGVFINHSLIVTIVCSKASYGFPISPSKNKSPFRVLYSQREALGDSLISLLIPMPPPTSPGKATVTSSPSFDKPRLPQLVDFVSVLRAIRNNPRL